MKLSDLDVVYIVKDAVYNDELRYSLRSIEKNFPHNRLWFVGGKPMYLHPDKQLVINQKGKTKWDRVRSMLKTVAESPNITEDFVLFNDDFFVQKPVEKLPVYRYGNLEQLCRRIERKNNDKPTEYTLNIKRTIDALKQNGISTLNFELHLPMIINRQKLLEIIETFPDTRGTRSLYGNMYLDRRATKPLKDVKIYDRASLPSSEQTFISTDDQSFAKGKVGEYIREMFSDKSRWER